MRWVAGVARRTWGSRGSVLEEWARGGEGLEPGLRGLCQAAEARGDRPTAAKGAIGGMGFTARAGRPGSRGTHGRRSARLGARAGRRRGMKGPERGDLPGSPWRAHVLPLCLARACRPRGGARGQEEEAADDHGGGRGEAGGRGAAGGRAGCAGGGDGGAGAGYLEGDAVNETLRVGSPPGCPLPTPPHRRPPLSSGTAASRWDARGSTRQREPMAPLVALRPPTARRAADADLAASPPGTSLGRRAPRR